MNTKKQYRIEFVLNTAMEEDEIEEFASELRDEAVDHLLPEEGEEIVLIAVQAISKLTEHDKERLQKLFDQAVVASQGDDG